MVIVTALNDADKKREALSNGAEAYVLKPDLFEQLPQLLQTPFDVLSFQNATAQSWWFPCGEGCWWSSAFLHTP